LAALPLVDEDGGDGGPAADADAGGT